MQKENLSNETKVSLISELIEKTKSNHSLPFYNTNEIFVPGVGPLDAKIMIIGEAPGREESIQGKPFVGRSGQLLSRILSEQGFDRATLFVTNVVKYRPPNNQTPTHQECMAWAGAYLRKEIEIIQPKIIITLGACATKTFLGEKISISKIHGNIFETANYKIVPMYHPAYLLRNSNMIKDVKQALNNVKEIHTEIVHNYVDNLLITCA